MRYGCTDAHMRLNYDGIKLNNSGIIFQCSIILYYNKNVPWILKLTNFHSLMYWILFFIVVGVYLDSWEQVEYAKYNPNINTK